MGGSMLRLVVLAVLALGWNGPAYAGKDHKKSPAKGSDVNTVAPGANRGSGDRTTRASAALDYNGGGKTVPFFVQAVRGGL